MANEFNSIAANALGILKVHYEGPIVSQFNDEIPFYKQCEKGRDKWTGLQVQRPIKVRRNGGIGATSDGGNLPKIGKEVVTQAIITARFNYLRFGITAGLIASSKNDKGAFISAMEQGMTGGMDDIKNDVNRQVQYDGSGTLATVSANAVASTVITVTGRESTEDGNKFLDIGMVIDVVNSAGAVVASAVEITDLSGTTTATLTLSAAVTVSATDIVVRSGAYNLEIQGLRYPLDGGTGTIWSVNRTTYPSFQGNATSGLGGQLTLDLMKQAWNKGKQRGGANYDYIKTDYATERFYEKLLIADKRYTGKVKGDGTFAMKDQNYLEYGGIPIVPDKDSPQEIDFVTSKTWKKYELESFTWANESGSYMLPQPGTDSFEVRLRLFSNLFCEKPSANSRLSAYISP